MPAYSAAPRAINTTCRTVIPQTLEAELSSATAISETPFCWKKDGGECDNETIFSKRLLSKIYVPMLQRFARQVSNVAMKFGVSCTPPIMPDLLTLVKVGHLPRDCPLLKVRHV